ncbi:hypothetical protein E3O25_10340 [Cryobacterium sp. TMT1-3]|uniref:hypothetical protein n=1 Tax=Cryobacterium sp. TMT1-3 TaxID=1259237 RepID=UPI00106BD09B|nr:hypothetical protein [Cryobacterium sp. TMT1-3]TFC27483.1 hypothetical protein E3O25_10340 [Cryobacterium sp. TMT1-3]
MLRLKRLNSPEPERGSSLLAVIGVMAVFAIISVTIVGSTMSAIRVSSSTQAGVQAQAAAEAGIDATAALLSTAPCTSALIQSIGVPKYSVTLSYQVGSDEWKEGCAPANASLIRVVSTGTAEATGSVVDPSDTRMVEAIYSVKTSGSAKTGGIAIYADLGFSVIESVTIHAKDSTIYVHEGNASCISSGANNVDIIVKAGDVTLGESCGIFGDVWASGAVKVEGSSIIHESLIAAKLNTLSTAQVIGNVWVSGKATIGLGTKIGGTLTAGSVAGLLGSILSVLTASGSQPPPVSNVADPGWFELNYKYSNNPNKIRVQSPKDQAHWKSFESVYRIEGVCGLPELQAAADSLAGRPGIIECAAGVDVASAGVLTLGSDIAVIAESFKFRESAQINSAAKHKLWLVTPDGSPNNKPTCNAKDGPFVVSQSFKVNPNVDVMVYSPCAVDISTSTQWRGQIWGGTVHLGTSGVYTYAEVGFPGAPSTGGAGTPSGTVTLGPRDSIRDVNG